MPTETARDGILDAAIGCIARFGLEHTLISGVAAAAKVSRPTIYTHFGTREELISAALAQAAAAVTERPRLFSADRAGSWYPRPLGCVVRASGPPRILDTSRDGVERHRLRRRQMP
jgi:AcrR family transcriptional regulator